jgi:transcriptional regulator with XRE-family HTH domain
MSTKEEFQTLLGQNVRRLRKYRNYTVEDLGLESGLGYSQVSRIELGKRNPTAYTLYMLSKALDVSPSEFFKLHNNLSDDLQR